MNNTVKAYAIAVGEIGVREIVGGKHNPRVIEYHKATTLKAKDDETSWCSSFMNCCFKEAGLKGTGSAASRSWTKYGKPVPLEEAKIGDVVVFWRGNPNGWMGHVGFFAGTDGRYIIVLGGNQGNKVCYKHIPISRLLGVRRGK